MFPIKPPRGKHAPIVTVPYGKPGNWLAGFHTGTDFGWTRRVEFVRATKLAVVVEVNRNDRYYGKTIVLQTGDRRHRYAHLAMIRPSIRVGKVVHTGRWLGIMGQTGNAFGRHLHYEETVTPHRYGVDSRVPVLFGTPAPKRLRGWQ